MSDSQSESHKCWICLDNFETPQGLGSHLANIGDRNPMHDIGEDHPLYGTTVSEERRQKIGKAMKGKLKGRTSPMKGRSYPADGKAKLSDALSGENNPMFNNWSSREQYPSEWSEDLKDFIRQLYHRTCQLCGAQPQQNLDVHHMDGSKENLQHSNLYPFCRSCHHKMEGLSWS